MVGPSFPKRLLRYFFGGVIVGLLRTVFYIGSGYIFGFFQDAAIFGAAYAILFGITMEIFKKARARKFKQVKLEIAQTSTILFNSAAILMTGTKPAEGWLFLTDENFIFRPRKFNSLQNPELIIPANSIQSVEKFKLRGFNIVANNVSYKIMADNRNKWLNLINIKLAALKTNS